MKTLTIPVNARNGSVAEAILSAEAKTQLRPGGVWHGKYAQFDIEGWSRPGPDLPASEVACSEVVKDESRLHTYQVTIRLYESGE